MRYIFVKSDVYGNVLIGQSLVVKSKAAAIRQTKAHSIERHFVREATLGSKLKLVDGPIISTIQVTI